MERARATWTDERLDDLARGMERGFQRVDEDIRELRTEMAGQRSDMTDMRTEMNLRFDAQHRLIVQVGGLTIATVIATVLGALVTALVAG